jgi:hypothetical protein
MGTPDRNPVARQLDKAQKNLKQAQDKRAQRRALDRAMEEHERKKRGIDKVFDGPRSGS